jgi:hypothetical protein
VLTGVWAKLDGLYLLAAADAATAQTNLIQSSYGLTVVGSPAFAADAGYTGTGATSAYLSTGLNPTVGSPQFSLNSGSLFAWKNTAPTGDAGLIAALSGENSYVQVFRPSDTYEWQINGNGHAAVGLTAQTGLFGRRPDCEVSGGTGVPCRARARSGSGASRKRPESASRCSTASERCVISS